MLLCFYLPPGVQPLSVRQRVDAGQRLLQEAGRQEVAQYGQSELHAEVHQALEWGLVHAGHHPEGKIFRGGWNIMVKAREV